MSNAERARREIEQAQGRQGEAGTGSIEVRAMK